MPTFAVNQTPRNVHPLNLVIPLWSTGPPFERQQGVLIISGCTSPVIKLVQHPGLLAAMHPRGGRGFLPSTPCAGASFSVTAGVLRRNSPCACGGRICWSHLCQAMKSSPVLTLLAEP